MPLHHSNTENDVINCEAQLGTEALKRLYVVWVGEHVWYTSMCGVGQSMRVYTYVYGKSFLSSVCGKDQVSERFPLGQHVVRYSCLNPMLGHLSPYFTVCLVDCLLDWLHACVPMWCMYAFMQTIRVRCSRVANGTPDYTLSFQSIWTSSCAPTWKLCSVEPTWTEMMPGTNRFTWMTS